MNENPHLKGALNLESPRTTHYPRSNASSRRALTLQRTSGISRPFSCTLVLNFGGRVDLGISRVFSIMFYCKLVDEELYKRKIPLIWKIKVQVVEIPLEGKGHCYPHVKGRKGFSEVQFFLLGCRSH